jgi:hypothetical protein
MTSPERFKAYCAKAYNPATITPFDAWQAAERDMLERAIALIQSHQDGGYRAELIVIGLIRQLKELLNEPR